MMHVLTIDPSSGKSGALGWALATTEGEIVTAGLYRRAKDESLEHFANAACLFICDRVSKLRQLDGTLRRIETVFVEKPKVYNVTRSKADPEDIINLALVAGICAGQLSATLSARARFVAVSEWKHNIDPDVLIARIRTRLDPAEAAMCEAGFARDAPRAKSLWHNGWDAVGIALWTSDRLHLR